MELKQTHRIPRPQSCGVMLSYKCNASCRHCMYACSPEWGTDWMTEENLDSLLAKLSSYSVPSPTGPENISLNHGLHFSGGEPFLNYPLLLTAIEKSEKYHIPSVFVETNCFWCKDDQVTKNKFLELKAAGMKGVMISVNPFYLEFVPFERTERAIRIAYEIFGDNLFVYQMEYYKRFLELGISETISYIDYLKIEKEEDFMRNVEFFLTGRPVYNLIDVLDRHYPRYDASLLLQQPCRPDFVRTWHNHFDNYGNYMPGYCGGLSYGNWENLDNLVDTVPDEQEMPVLSMIMKEDFSSLLSLAVEKGYSGLDKGYFSKCHLCLDIRKYLSENGDYAELKPKAYYQMLK
jgi:4Fe-4S single cluster domain